ncbi:MAG TPA: RnfH family protein [Candidatus Competibacteraceae bacterium]|nr:RnfH family protein [Candidatus Competibacteraceae bacterium]HPF58820.1 RnfH family protein [Candidatus Competibacteraceae bacterium]HRY18331.1 RnfH family protein [Candidatus Competibacteraceae bacterium]
MGNDNAPNPAAIRIEVAYAQPDRQLIIPVEIPEGTTLEQAIIQSRIHEQFPEIQLQTAKVGVFGKLSKLSAIARAGDRIEIYRPLLADPKEVRKKRAAEGKRMRRGGGDLESSSG